MSTVELKAMIEAKMGSPCDLSKLSGRAITILKYVTEYGNPKFPMTFADAMRYRNCGPKTVSELEAAGLVRKSMADIEGKIRHAKERMAYWQWIQVREGYWGTKAEADKAGELIAEYAASLSKHERERDERTPDGFTRIGE